MGVGDGAWYADEGPKRRLKARMHWKNPCCQNKIPLNHLALSLWATENQRLILRLPKKWKKAANHEPDEQQIISQKDLYGMNCSRFSVGGRCDNRGSEGMVDSERSSDDDDKEKRE